MSVKYVNTEIVFAEIPDETSLAINISNCKIHCPDCHSKFLWENIGQPLDYMAIDDLITKNSDITCVLFMGGDFDYIHDLAIYVKSNYNLKTAYYSGEDYLPRDISYLDYIKIGHYDSSKGPLNNPNTNQRLYQIVDNTPINITYKFWSNELHN